MTGQGADQPNLPKLPCHVSTQLDLVMAAKINAVARASNASVSLVMGEALTVGIDALTARWSVTYEEVAAELDRVVIAKRHAARAVELRAAARERLRRSGMRRARAARGTA